MLRNVSIVLLALAVLIGSGLVHGVWTDRWGGAPEYEATAARLAALPKKFGDWDGEWTAVDRAEYPWEIYGAGVVGRFVNSADGSLVTVYLAVGRPGPMTVHAPELCYGGGGFHRAVPEQEHATTCGSPPRSVAFTHATFSKTDGPVPQHVHVMWSWCAAGAWQAHTSPRISLARYRTIAKLYLITPVPGPNDPLKDNRVLAFLQLLIPELDSVIPDKA